MYISLPGCDKYKYTDGDSQREEMQNAWKERIQIIHF